MEQVADRPDRVDVHGREAERVGLRGWLQPGFSLVDSDVVEAWDSSPNLVALRELGGHRIHSLDYRLLRSDHQFQ